jgi:hypothetical protein
MAAEFPANAAPAENINPDISELNIYIVITMVVCYILTLILR